jgi:hypothetical protein
VARAANLSARLRSKPRCARRRTGRSHENLGDLHVRLAAAEYALAAKLDRDGKSASAKLALARDLLAQAAPPKPKSP